MNASLHAAVSHEITNIVNRHLEALGRYILLAEPAENLVPDNVVTALDKLAAICEYAPDPIPQALYEEASECRDNIAAFLEHMNQKQDATFAKTTIGRILMQADEWFAQTAERCVDLSAQQVWDLIAPVAPDHLEDLGDGLYEARWWKPVPMMDIEILMRTENIIIHGEPFEPRHLPRGLAVRFSIQP
ncbi:MAG: hypothetical protein IT324_08735 [Anaerolineae bacterium]|nr:hypothetical protein [Anaerolineae bacterium]